MAYKIERGDQYINLNAYLDRFLDTGEIDGIEEYMSGWIEESFMFADKII